MSQAETVEDLVLRAQLGDAEAYEAIYRRFQNMAFAYAYSFLGDFELAEDAKQEAFIGAYCDLLSLREPAAFPGWFRQIVRKHSITIRRGRRSLMVPLDAVEEIASEGPGPSETAQKREIQQRVSRAVSRLPARQREVTRLHHLEGRSLRETSRLTGLPEKTVRSQLRVARSRLRERLMTLVKTTVQQRHLSGDKQAAQAATAEAVAQFDAELKSLLKVPGEKELQRAADLLCAKGRLLRFMGKMDDALASFQEGLAVPALRRDPFCRVRFRTEIGLTRIQTSDYALAGRELQRSRIAARRLKEGPSLLPVILNGLGVCAWGKGDFKAARRRFRQTLEAGQAGKWAVLEAAARNNLALLDWKDGRLEAALENFRASRKKCKQLRNRFGWALVVMNVGIVEENLGRYTPAQRHYEEALAVAKEVNYIQVQAASLTNLGSLALNQGKWRRALDRNARALELAREIGDRRSQAIALENLALAHVGLKESDKALDVLRDARETAKAIGDEERLFSLDLVEIEIEAGGLSAATEPGELPDKVEGAEQVLRRKGYTSEVPRLLRLKAQAHALSGEDNEARGILRKAIRECRKQKNRPEEKKALALQERLSALRSKG